MTAPSARVVEIPVRGMSCASCVGRVERALKAAPGVRDAAVNLASGRARVTLTEDGAATAAAEAIRASGYEPAEHSVELKIAGMTCASCLGRVERALKAAPGVLDAAVNLATERATIRVIDGATDQAALIAAVKAAGYAAEPVGAPDVDAQDREQAARAAELRGLGRAVAVAALATLPLFVVEMGSHFIPGAHHWLNGAVGQTPWRPAPPASSCPASGGSGWARRRGRSADPVRTGPGWPGRS